MILVFGKTGQVAMELQRILPEGRFLGRGEADLSDPGACARAILDLQPEAVINAAAYTAVDKAEDEEALAHVINAEAPGAMARACAQLQVPLVHISTDYVFDGAGDAPFAVDHPVAPLGAYGRSKLAGEEAVRGANGPHAIFRTSWVVSAHGSNFVKTMLRLGADRDHLNIVADQIGGPTPAAEIAETCVTAARQLIDDPSKTGTYHLSGGPDVSWADFAREIFTQSGLGTQVTDIPSSDYPTPAKRPLNSRLDNSLTQARFGRDRADWRQGLARILQDLGAVAS